MRIVGLREQGPALLAAAADQRLRAFTVFRNAYEDARRAVAYLRGRQGDADSIAPSLYPGRPRKRTTAPDPNARPQTPPAALPVPAPSGASHPSSTARTVSAAPVTIAGTASKDPFLP